MDDFFTDPVEIRSAKRRKITTYSSSRTMTRSPTTHPRPADAQTFRDQHKKDAPSENELETSPSIFRKVSNAVVGIGNRLFEPKAKNRPQQIDGQTQHSSKRQRKSKEMATDDVSTSIIDHEDRPSDEDELATDELMGTPTKSSKVRKNGSAVNGHLDQEETIDAIPLTTRSGRQRRKPRRFSDDDSVANTPKQDVSKEPRSILSPSKSTRQKRGRIKRKSVTFQSEPTEDALAFDNIEVSPPFGPKSPSESILPIGNYSVEESQLEDEPIEVPELLEEPEHPPLPKILFEDSDPEIDHLKSVLFSRLTRQSLTPLMHLPSEYQKVHSLLFKTVTSGEGNSMLILGSRGTGKRTLVETALMELRQEHHDDFHAIRLNGFFQSDDKLALREIWRQLGREMETDEDENKTGSYADTLSSLLALLSHPDEFEIPTDTDQSLSNGQRHRTSRAVIFIMEEFDIFASHPRQTLLYNLFDIAQARKAPIAVIGLSTRVDVAECLEKRVKSRFSQRCVFVPQAKNLEVFKEICKRCLTVSAADSAQEKEKPDKIYVDRWNKWVDQLFSKDKAMQRHLSSIYTSSKSASEFQRSCLAPISNLRALIDKSSCVGTQKGTLPTGEEFSTRAQLLSPPDSILAELPSLTQLQLAMLIAAARLDLIYGGGRTDSIGLSFESVYTEYVRLLSESRITSSASGMAVSSRIWGREVAEGGWEELIEKDFLLRAGKTDVYKVEVLLEEIVPGFEAAGGSVPDELRRWCRDI